MWKLAYQDSSLPPAASSASAGAPGRPSMNLSLGTFVIGRGVKCDVELCKDNTLSRQHATVRVVQTSFKPKDPASPHFALQIHDGSYNEGKRSWKPSQSGTFVNGKRLDGGAEEWTRVQPGDSLQFSKHKYTALLANVAIAHSKIPSSGPKQRIEKLAQEAGVRIVKDIAAATHLIMTEGSATPKAVAALARGLPIITINWLADVVQETTPPAASNRGNKSRNVRRPTYLLPNSTLSVYRPPLATDSIDMVSPAKYFPVEGRKRIFTGDTFFVPRSDSNSSWLKTAIEGCGGTISFEVRSNYSRQAYVFSSKNEAAKGFIAAAKTAGAHEISVSVLASAVVRSVAILQSIHLYSQSQVSQRLSQRASSRSPLHSQQLQTSQHSQQDPVFPQADNEVDDTPMPDISVPDIPACNAAADDNHTENRNQIKLEKVMSKEINGPVKYDTRSEAEPTKKRGRNHEGSSSPVGSKSDNSEHVEGGKIASVPLKGNKRHKTASKFIEKEAECREKDEALQIDGDEDNKIEKAGENRKEKLIGAVPGRFEDAVNDDDERWRGSALHDEDSDCACLGGEVGDYGAEEDIPDSFKRPHANSNGVKWLSSSTSLKAANKPSEDSDSLVAEVYEDIFIPRQVPAETKTISQRKRKLGGRGKLFVKQRYTPSVQIPFADLSDFQQPLSGQYVEMHKDFCAKEANSAAALDLFSGPAASKTGGRRRGRSNRKRR